MQALATGVGDLKRVLSNIKSRGTWGEGSLGTLLEQIMTPEQYALNVEIVPHSGQRVEYAIKLPGNDAEGPVCLPIDSKMPLGDYERLIAASEQGDAASVEAAAKALERTILGCAKDICSKYIRPPHSTDFAVMFLPTEGLFAEVVRRTGLINQLQSDCRVIVTGPTTLMALLSSLRMGFRTLAIQERSSEVWQVLGAVKTEFSKFGEVIDKVHKKLNEAQNVVEQARTRRKAVDRKLRDVEALPEAATRNLLTLAVDEILDEVELPSEPVE
jgi:DNA recombination protein RmuC